MLPLETAARDRVRFRRAVAWLLFGNLAVGVLLTLAGNELKTDAAANGLLSFEFAGSAEEARAIVGSWTEAQRAYAGFALGLDYLFMPLYAAGLALLCTKAVLAARARGLGWVARAGGGMAWAAPLAALLDAVENAAALAQLVDAPTDGSATVVVVSATAKFALLALVVLYLLAALAALLARRRSSG